MGNPVVVENITGAGGNIAIDRAIKAAPDGYTLVMASSAITINPSLYVKTSYDPIRDLAPISMAVFTPNILVVNNEVPAKNVQELIALARSQPGKLTYGHAGIGTPAHLFWRAAQVIGWHRYCAGPLPWNTGVVAGLLAGRLTMTLPNMSVVLPLVREGKLRALAAISPTRTTAASDLPTMGEQGLPGFDPIWFGLMAPAGTSQSIITTLHRETVRALTAKDALKRLGDAGMEVVANTPTEFAAVIKSELSRWAKLIKDAGIKVSE